MTHSYEERYKKVYNAGARFWEPPIPTEELVEFIRDWNMPRDSKIIEFGCGEGRDAIFLAKSGFNVTAIDIAPSAIQRAKEWAHEEGVEVNFLVNDVTALKGIPDEYYDLGVNIGCLQMFPKYEDRQKHLSEAFRVLKPKTIFYLCNMAVLTKEEINQQFGLKWQYLEVGELISRKIVVNRKEKEILLPIIAKHDTIEEEITNEMNETGFKILQMDRVKTRPYGICWIVVVQKP